ncbi:hypothetical protein I4U23_000538 [Adineta vaga]|nr:hypothetical protein I4U23_000538 [Adineta vaga]
MYPQSSPNRQFKYQPVINSNLTHAILCNQNSGHQLHIGIPPATPKHHSHKDKQSPSYIKRDHKIKNITKQIEHVEVSSNKPPIHSLSQKSSKHERSLFRPSSFESIPPQRSVPLPSSYSVTNIHDRIQRERKAHTMPPLAHIVGPSTSPKAKLFASIVAPVDTQAGKSTIVTQDVVSTRTSICSKRSEVEMTDDDATVIVKVRYDPESGGPPSEDTVRQAIDNQLIQRSGLNKKKEPIVVNFIGQNLQPNLPIRPHQPTFNRQILPFQQRPSLRIPIQSQPSQIQQNPFPLPRPTQPTTIFPLPPPVNHIPQNSNIRPAQALQPSIRQQTFPFRVPLNRTQRILNPPQTSHQIISPLQLISSQRTGFLSLYILYSFEKISKINETIMILYDLNFRYQ